MIILIVREEIIKKGNSMKKVSTIIIISAILKLLKII
jgi:hypothetical protein